MEERSLVKLLAPAGARGPAGRRRVDVFVVGRFATPGRQGESFVTGGRSRLGDVTIVDWRAFFRARQAYALPHEIAHVLLGDLGHPDARGDDRRGLLMHSRASAALRGPRHLTPSECDAIRDRLGTGR